MAGEKLAKLTVRAFFSRDDFTRALQTTRVRFRLAGTWYAFDRGADPGQYTVPDPDDDDGGQHTYVLHAVTNLLALVKATVTQRNLPYLVSDPRDAGDDALTGRPLVDFDVSALDYSPPLDLAFEFPVPNGGGFFPGQGTGPDPGWQVLANQATVFPLLATAQVTDAGIFGSATGAIDIVVSQANGYAFQFVYAWADAPALPTNTFSRTGLAAGTYYCTITDSAGASARVTAIVGSDDRLEVQVNTTSASATLVPSGGLPPYAFLWDDGTTTATRAGLAPGTYRCTVTDARGATRAVEVIIAAGSRYWFSGNPITLALDAGDAYRLDPATKPGLSFVCRVWVELDYGSDVFVPVGQAQEQPADRDGRTVFEVQELLEPFVAPVVPPVGAAALARAAGQFRRFFLQHYERTDAGDAAATTVETSYLLHGGFDYYEAAAGTWFSQYQPAQLPFLTWEPATKKVLPDQPEFLYFLVPVAGLAGFRCRLRVFFADATVAELTVAEGPAAERYEVFCLPAGPGQLNLAAQEAAAGAAVVRYELDVVDAGGAPLSEARTYVLDRRPAPGRRYFLYANSLGGFNTLVCRGRAALDFATKTSTSENARAPGYDPLRGDYTINRRTGLPTLKCYTGPRSAAQLVADRDFLLSERVLLLDQGRWLAGLVKDRTFTPYDEDETRRVVQFDYELPRERYYTPRLA